MDVRENKIKLSDGAEISYDKCLIATGETNCTRMYIHMWLSMHVQLYTFVRVCIRWGTKEPASD